jgi:hypothetical protein
VHCDEALRRAIERRTTKEKKMPKKKAAVVDTLNQTLEQLNKSLDTADAQLGSEATSLTTAQKRRLGRSRKGGERILQMIAELVKSHGLESTALQSAPMLADQERAASYAASLARLQKMEKRISDDQFVAQSNAWEQGLQFYALLQRRAQSDGTLAASLAPVTAFFNYRHDSAKPTKLQTRANAKLRDAQRLVARAKPRASVLEEETETSAPAPVAVTPASAAVAPKPSVIVNAPAASNGATPTMTNGTSNGAVNGYTNGASNGASSV